MTQKTTLSQMLEHLVNDEQQKAEELFHEYVVAKSREIYEELIESEIAEEEDDEEGEEEDEVDESFDDESFDDETFEADDDIGGDPTDDLESDLDADMDDEGDMDDLDMDDQGDRDPEELFQDLESIVDELQAKFDEMGGEDDMDDEGDMDTDDEGDMDMDDEGDEEPVKDSFDDELATVREYVEKIGAPKMGDNGTNTKSIVAGKNDMGGTTANILSDKGHETSGTKGGLAAPTTKEDNAGNVNVPGGKAGVKHLSKKPGHGAEKKATGDNGDKSTSSLFRGRR